MISQEEIDEYSHLSELLPGRTTIHGLPEGTSFRGRFQAQVPAGDVARRIAADAHSSLSDAEVSIGGL